MKETKKKVVNIQEYKEKRKQKEVDRKRTHSSYKTNSNIKIG